jgi:beta-phosphoglucomutase-like phosphatase (HAD superfamily)
MKAVRQLTWQLSEHYAAALTDAPQPAAGLMQWLEAAAGKHAMPCAAVSHLDRATARHVLERVHLHDHFQV